MSHLVLFNFLLYNFLHMSNLRNILIFHCWSDKSLLNFAKLANTGNSYLQYAHLDEEHFLLKQLEERPFTHDLTKLGVFFDLNCNRSDYMLDLANEEALFTHRYHWLLYDELGNLSKIEEFFEQAKLSLDADITYVQPTDYDNKNANFILYDIYSKGSHLGSPLNITIDQEIACNHSSCHVARYLSELHTRTRLQHRKLLTGLTLRVTAVVNALPLSAPEPEILEFLGSRDNIHIDSFARFGYQSRQVLKDMLDCNYSYIFRDRWSRWDITGGLIGDILNETVDLSIGPFAFSSFRALHFRGLTQFSAFRSVCMFLNPQAAGLRATEFLQPFSWSVWTMFGAVLLLSGVLLWLTFRLERQKFKTSLLTSCLLSFGAACIQGAWLTPRSTGGRMAFYVLMLTSFMMYNYYTSIVVSTLLGQPPRSNIRTVNQLAESALEVSVETTPYVRVYVETSTRPEVENLRSHKFTNSKKSISELFLPTEIGVLQVRNRPGFVFIAEAATAYEFVRKYFLPEQICQLNEILLRPEAATHTLVHKNSSYGELFKLSELRMMETGIHNKHEVYWRRTKLHCYQNNLTVVVGLDYAAPFFIMLACVYLLCLIILGFEIVWHRRQLRCRKNLS